MKSYLKLSLLLFGVLFITAYCQEEEGEEVETDGEMVPAEEGEEGDEEEGEGEEGHEEEEEEGEEPEDDEDGINKMEALTPEQMHALHKSIDSNGNGKVSLAEVTDFAHKMRRALANSELVEIMKDMDIDKDGKLSWMEFLTPEQASELPEEEQNEKHAQFKELDTNKDQHLDMDELAQMYHHHTNDKVETELTNVAMKEKDEDKNGVLSLREFFQHLQMEGESPVEIPEDDQAVFKKLDADGSGTLTLKELKAWESGSFQAEEAAKKVFAKADKDKDNVLTKEEMAEVRQEMAEDEDYEPQMYLSQWAEQHVEHGEL